MKYIILIMISSLFLLISCSNDKENIVNTKGNKNIILKPTSSPDKEKIEKLNNESLKETKQNNKEFVKAEKLDKEMLKKDSSKYFKNESVEDKNNRIKANIEIEKYMEKIRAKYKK